MTVVTGVTTTKSTSVHNYQLESGFTKKLLEFVWSEQLVLDGKPFFLTQLGITCFANKSLCTELGIKIDHHQCLMSWYGKSISFKTKMFLTICRQLP